MDCYYSNKLSNKLTTLNEFAINKVNISEINKAVFYAKKYHGSQMRESGEPYYSHPLEVAYILAEYTALKYEKYFRDDLIITSILHDTLEDTELTFEMISETFGEIIAQQVLDLTRVKHNGYKPSAAETIKKLWHAKKYDVLLVKYFDRLHNLQTIDAKSAEKIAKITDETIEIFIALSIALQMPELEKQLTEICYKYLPIKLPFFYPQAAHILGSNLTSRDSYLLLSQAFQNTSAQMQILNIEDI